MHTENTSAKFTETRVIESSRSDGVAPRYPTYDRRDDAATHLNAAKLVWLNAVVDNLSSAWPNPIWGLQDAQQKFTIYLTVELD